jgi:hypothetical protein
MAVHKGTELSNVAETWNQNEQLRKNENNRLSEDDMATTPGVSDELAETIRQEATEYDNTSHEDRLLDGERATLNDAEKE